jgi:hypothetical protein
MLTCNLLFHREKIIEMEFFFFSFFPHTYLVVIDCGYEMEFLVWICHVQLFINRLGFGCGTNAAR